MMKVHLKEDPKKKPLPNEYSVGSTQETVEAPSDMKLGDTAADLAKNVANNVSGLASSFTNFFKYVISSAVLLGLELITIFAFWSKLICKPLCPVNITVFEEI